MRTIQKTVYTFGELDPRAKERARDWYRTIALAGEWWAPVYDDFTTIATALGYEIAERGGRRCIWFRGFSSQGDGACFAGTYRAEDCSEEAILDYLGPLDRHPDRILARIVGGHLDFAAAHPTFTARLTHRGLYYHERSVEYDSEELDRDGNNIVSRSTEDEFQSLARDLMRWLYGRLESEHEYRLSDEAIDDDIAANGYEFDRRGRRNHD